MQTASLGILEEYNVPWSHGLSMTLTRWSQHAWVSTFGYSRGDNCLLTRASIDAIPTYLMILVMMPSPTVDDGKNVLMSQRIRLRFIANCDYQKEFLETCMWLARSLI